MDMLDPTLDTSSQDKGNDSATSDDASQIHSDDGTVSAVGDNIEEQTVTIASVTSQAGLIDPTVQYQFRAENGQGGAVTYRVVQVSPDDGSVSQAVTSATLVAPQVAQAIIPNPFTTANGGGSPTGEGQIEDSKFMYFPAVSAATAADGSCQSDAALAASATGQFYVMMSPQDVLQTGQRALAPRTHQFSPKVDGTKTARDERRRATHNEVERRRRDKINNWIVKLSKIVPECHADHNKQGQVSSNFSLQSKGGILAKTCDYIHELRNANSKLPELVKENEKLTIELEVMRQQFEDLKNENEVLRAHLQQNGIDVAEMGASAS